MPMVGRTGLAPGYDDPGLQYASGHGVMVAHGRAMQAMRAARGGLQSGIVLNFVPIYPSEDTPEARAHARRWWTRTSRGCSSGSSSAASAKASARQGLANTVTR